MTLMLYPMMANFIVMGALLPFVYEPLPLLDMALMALVAILALLAMWLVILAYRMADAVIVAPMQYSQILWAVFFGTMFFGEEVDQAPDPVLLGMVAMLVPTIATIQITFCVPFLFTFTSMARSKVSAVNAIKLSIQTTTQNLAIVLKVAALLMLLHIIASIAFLLPAALLLPLHYAVIHQLHFRLTN